MTQNDKESLLYLIDRNKRTLNFIEQQCDVMREEIYKLQNLVLDTDSNEEMIKYV